MPSVTLNHDVNLTLAGQAEFYQELSEFVKKAQVYGLSSLSAYSAKSKMNFEALSPDRQQQVRMSFKDYSHLVFGPEPEPVPHSEAQLLQVCARKLGLVFDSSAYSGLTADHVIEVYNSEMLQIYRNLSFFSLCSYDLLDLLTNEFYELYERSYAINEELFKASQVLSNRPYNLEPYSMRHTPRHIMREKISAERRAFQVQFQSVYPVYTWSRTFYGFLVIQEAKLETNIDVNLRFL